MTNRPKNKGTIFVFSTIFLIFLFCAEKGILKKPGPPYCPLDKDRWDDRLSSSSQNNLVNLTGGMVDSGSRQQMPERPDSRRTEISDVERTLKSLNGYHEDILEVRH